MSDAMSGSQWERMKQQAAQRFEGVENPMDREQKVAQVRKQSAELKGAKMSSAEENEAIAASGLSQEYIQGLRAKNAEIDPNYARIQQARGRAPQGSGRVGASERGVGRDVSESIGGLSPAASPSEFGVLHNVGEGKDVEADASFFTEDDPAARRPRIGATSLGGLLGEERPATSPFEKHVPTNTSEAMARMTGWLYLKTAGGCNHPRCQMVRQRGLELLGHPVSNREFGKGAKATQPEIPSVPVQRKQKTSSGAIETVMDVEPANKGDVDAWVREFGGPTMMSATKSILTPQDFLQHHHGPEDLNFEKNPLPWHQR